MFPLDANKLHVGRIENDGTIDYEVGTITIGTDSVTYQANTTWRGFYTDFIQAAEDVKLTMSPNTSSAISISCSCYDGSGTFLGRATATSTSTTKTFTLLQGTVKVRISVTSSDTSYTITKPMLNSGSTALPYEPWGVKIPILSANTTTPVYLGEVQTTRKIKKLVFTGNETIGGYDSTYNRFSIIIPDSLIIGVCLSPVICSHYQTISDGRGIANVPNNAIYSDSGISRWFIKTTEYTNDTDFKAYLAQQYAAGTPVVVWYVLAEPTTGIVNEPLMKIGNYADSISGITIPVTAGGDTLSVDTTLQPSEVTVNYKGWHPVQSVHERENGAWD